MRKVWILALLFVVLAAGTWTGKAEANATDEKSIPFADVSGHWAEKEIRELYIGGALEQEDKFRPDDRVTRQELIVMFLRAKGIRPEAKRGSSFADVPADSWLAPHAETAYRLGIVHGVRSGEKVWLHPQDPVTREEMVSILVRICGRSGAVNQLKWSDAIKTLNAYPDGNQVQVSYQRPFAYALKNRLVSAYPDGTLKSGQLMTRAEAATYAAIHLLNKREGKQFLSQPGTLYRQALTVETTAYSYPPEKDVLSYLEYPLREGVVAVDPQVIPLGSHLYIEGYGYAVAADIGGAVKENHVDLYLSTVEEAKRHGTQQGVKVYVLD